MSATAAAGPGSPTLAGSGSPTPAGPAGEPVAVPWSVLPDYRCFGCSPHNEGGLRLRFWEHPEGLETVFVPGRGFESYPGVVHGGVVGTVCDEAMGNLLVLRYGRSAFTVSMKIRYVAPLATDQEYRCVARLLPGRGESDLCHAAAEVLDNAGQTMATASGVYQPVTMQRAREHLMLSDDEAAMLERSLGPARSSPS